MGSWPGFMTVCVCVSEGKCLVCDKECLCVFDWGSDWGCVTEGVGRLLVSQVASQTQWVSECGLNTSRHSTTKTTSLLISHFLFLPPSYLSFSLTNCNISLSISIIIIIIVFWSGGLKIGTFYKWVTISHYNSPVQPLSLPGSARGVLGRFKVWW